MKVKVNITVMVLLIVLILSSACRAEDVLTTVLDIADQNTVIELKKNVPVTYIAEPEKGYIFVGWSGACSGKGECTITPTKDGERFELYARFEKQIGAPKNLRRSRK